jgi:hypothetical protein
MAEIAPKLFVSYSWSSPEHEQWVVKLASELVENDVDVILDKWDLKEGQESTKFMERMVTDPQVTKVIIVCDRVYAEKADTLSRQEMRTTSAASRLPTVGDECHRACWWRSRGRALGSRQRTRPVA